MAVIELDDPHTFTITDGPPQLGATLASTPGRTLRIDTDNLIGKPVTCQSYPGYAQMLRVKGRGDDQIVLARETRAEIEQKTLTAKRNPCLKAALHTAAHPASVKPAVTMRLTPPAVKLSPAPRPVVKAAPKAPSRPIGRSR